MIYKLTCHGLICNIKVDSLLTITIKKIPFQRLSYWKRAKLEVFTQWDKLEDHCYYKRTSQVRITKTNLELYYWKKLF